MKVKEDLLLTISEISSMFGVPARTIRDRLHRVLIHENIEYGSQWLPGQPVRYWTTKEFVEDIVKGGKAREYYAKGAWKGLQAMVKNNKARAAGRAETGEARSASVDVSVSAERSGNVVRVSATFDKAAVRRFIDFIHSFR